MSIKETNILKGFGIILMYFHHLFYLKENFVNYDIDFGALSEEHVMMLSQMCKVCVAIFVFATAYGIAKSLGNKYSVIEFKWVDLSEYSIGRYVKLMSGFWMIYVLAQITSFVGDRYKIYGSDLKLRIKYMIIDFFGSANLLGTPTINATWWYMSLAILLVFLMPILWRIVRQIGVISLIIALFLPVYMGLNMGSSIPFYLFTIVAGILFAENNWFEKYKDKLNISWIKRVFLGICFVILLYLLLHMRWKAVSTVVVALYDGVFTIILCFLCILISCIPVIAKGLEFIGIHSMNMFLVHTFIKAYYFQDFSYRWKYPWLILLILLIDTLLISVVIEWIKKITGYNKLTNYLVNKSKLITNKIRG